MADKRGFWVVLFLAVCCVVMTPGAALAFSEDAPAAAVKESEEVGSDSEEIKEIEEKEAAARDAIKQQEEDMERVQEEAERAAREKEAIEEEARIKEREAEAAKKELELAEKEAKVTKAPEVVKKAKKLASEAEKLKKEAEISKEKLSVAEAKAKTIDEKLAANEARFEELREELRGLRREKSAKRGLLDKILSSLVMILVGLVLFFLTRKGVKKFEKAISKEEAIREKGVILRIKTLSKLFNWLGGFIIIGAVIYMVLENFGFSVAPILAGAGIVGLAFGFGGQYLIRDLINGLFILIEGQYRINDVVKIGEYGGLVEDINLRITVLRDLAGRVIIIPNGEIKTVVNYTKEFSQALLDIGVAYKEDIDRVTDVIKEVGRGMREDEHFGKLILDDLEMLGVEEFADSQVTIRFRIKTLPIKQWEVSREFRKRLKRRFDELNIEIPFPHRTVYWGTGADNDWMKELLNKDITKPKER